MRKINFTLIFLAIVVCLLVVISVIPAMHVETYTVEIIKTEITGDDDYMVFGKNSVTGETQSFTLNDSFWHGSFDTADIYASLTVGNTYQLRATGWRIPFLSAFPNIVEVTPVK